MVHELETKQTDVHQEVGPKKLLALKHIESHSSDNDEMRMFVKRFNNVMSNQP